MGNMDPFINLSVAAKQAGGPDAFMKSLSTKGTMKGIAAVVVVWAAREGAGQLVKRHKTRKANLAAKTADAIAKAEARRSFRIAISAEMESGLSLTVGEIFRVLTRDSDAVQIEIENRDDNPFYVSGVELQKISDFVLDDVDSL